MGPNPVAPSVCLFFHASSQPGCLRSIGQDLHHYYRFLSAQPDPERLLLTALLSSLQDFMQVIYLSIIIYLSIFLRFCFLKSTNMSQKTFILNRNASLGPM